MRKCPVCGFVDPAALRADKKWQAKVKKAKREKRRERGDAK